MSTKKNISNIIDGLVRINESGNKIDAKLRNKLNKIAKEYSGWMTPREFTHFYDEVGELGVDIDLITGYGQKSAGGTKSWTVRWSYNGEYVDNSMFVYQVYEPEDGNKYEFNVYFS